MSVLLSTADIVALLAGTSTVVLLIRRWKKNGRGDIRVVFCVLILTTLFRHVSNVLESVLQVGRLDQVEDLIEILRVFFRGGFGMRGLGGCKGRGFGRRGCGRWNGFF